MHSITRVTHESGDRPDASQPSDEVSSRERDELRPSSHWPLLPMGVLERACAGDSEALGSFFDHYFPRLFATVLRLVRDPVAAQDVTQEVLLKIQRNLPRLDTTRDPAPWLFTIAVNACRDLWRTRAWRMSQRSRPIEDPLIAHRLPVSNNRPDVELERKEETRLLEDAIGRLPESLRVTVILHDCEGIGHREIAAITGIDYAASRKRHSRALKALGDMLRGVIAP